MGVYLDIDMPRTCAECPLFEYGALSNCKLLKTPLMWYEAHEGRDKECPLRETAPRASGREKLEGAGFEW